MKKITIEITKAQILSYSVTLQEESPRVCATIGLFTDGGKKISEYSIDTESWNDQNKFELPLGIEAPIIEIMKKLETVVVKHMRDSQLALPGNNPF